MISFFSFKEKNTPGVHLPEFLQPIEIDAFLEEHSTLIKRLKLAYSEKSSWETRILPCVRELALVAVIFHTLPMESLAMLTGSLKRASRRPLMPSKSWKAPYN